MKRLDAIPRFKLVKEAITDMGLYTPTEIQKYLKHKTGKEYKIKTIQRDLEWDYLCSKMVLSGEPVSRKADLSVLASIIFDILTEILKIDGKQVKRKATPIKPTEHEALETLRQDPQFKDSFEYIEKILRVDAIVKRQHTCMVDFDRLLELAKRLNFLILQYGPKINFDEQKQQDK
ncbi:MAG: hypothetical protein OXC46_04640 [Thaumarchaeota archaeon]|nr:hypothetical protein [Nitrososphaerota archaeon]